MRLKYKNTTAILKLRKIFLNIGFVPEIKYKEQCFLSRLFKLSKEVLSEKYVYKDTITAEFLHINGILVQRVYLYHYETSSRSIDVLFNYHTESMIRDRLKMYEREIKLKKILKKK